MGKAPAMSSQGTIVGEWWRVALTPEMTEGDLPSSEGIMSTWHTPIGLPLPRIRQAYKMPEKWLCESDGCCIDILKGPLSPNGFHAPICLPLMQHEIKSAHVRQHCFRSRVRTHKHQVGSCASKYELRSGFVNGRDGSGGCGRAPCGNDCVAIVADKVVS
jgi:hypothetical protein